MVHGSVITTLTVTLVWTLLLSLSTCEDAVRRRAARRGTLANKHDLGSQKTKAKRSNSVDPHGGVPMGVLDDKCDNARDGISIDWDPSSTKEYTCFGERLKPASQLSVVDSCTDHTKMPTHICITQSIHYDESPPTSGRHRPEWAVYGTYGYVPPQRWLHNMEHGAVVFLYHPCADHQEVAEISYFVKNCLRKHIITPYPNMTEDKPFMLLTWGCKRAFSKSDCNTVQQFITDHAKHAPEGHYAAEGNYNTSLLIPAAIVSDSDDSVICPSRCEGSSASDVDKPLGEEQLSGVARPYPYLKSIGYGRTSDRQAYKLRRQKLQNTADELKEKIGLLSTTYARISKVHSSH